ncbi:MAG: TadE/TadG family type IV pilus assembly protein [Bacillota bacterium]
MRSAREDQAGYVAVYFALVASLVLVPLVMLAVDVAALAYARAKLQSAADALALGAVAESRTWHVPVPTKVVAGVPVEGVLLSGLHLSNLSMSFGLGSWGGNSKIETKLQSVAKLQQDATGRSLSMKPETAKVMPLGNFFSPFMYVRMPVTGTVTPQTPFLGRLLGQEGGEIQLKAESCAVAWYRVDRWVQSWWDPDLLDTLFDLEGKPAKYYRRINCLKDLDDWVNLAEFIPAEHYAVTRERPKVDMGPLRKWFGDSGEDKETKRAKEGMRRKRDELKEECRKGDPCLEQGRTKEWVEHETERRQAEEEAEKAREKARLEAARRAAAATDQQDGGK